MNNYDSTITFWDQIFNKYQPKSVSEVKLPKVLKSAIDWVSGSSESILDYGCGNGTLLFKCLANKNVCNCLGIDISEKAIELAKSTAKFNNSESRTSFLCGGIEVLQGVKEDSYDGAILSNIIDNIMPDDAAAVLKNIKRIVRPQGKVLVKLNPYLTEEDMKEYGAELAGENLYLEKDGIYLWNLDTDAWKEKLEKYFAVENYEQIYFEQFNQYNRAFYLMNNK